MKLNCLSILFFLILYTHVNSQVLFDERVITDIYETTDGARSVIAADFNGDGYLDVVVTSHNDNKVSWYENYDGQGNFDTQNTISFEVVQPVIAFPADLDGDGDMDVISGSEADDKVAWYENTNGLGQFGPQNIISISSPFVKSLFAADLDSDGDLDVLSASSGNDKIVWYKNLDGNGSFSTEILITPTINTESASYITVGDIDNDGDLDVLSASGGDNKIAWYENLDENANFGPQQIICSDCISAWAVHVSDIDNDGDLDVLSTSVNDNIVAWFENLDGNGTFGSKQIISNNFNRPRTVFSADFDNDGDMDVVVSSTNDDKVVWFENLDGNGSFGSQIEITNNTVGPYFTFPADINGDGNIDVLTASQFDDRVAWYENEDGQGNFGPQNNITRYDIPTWPSAVHTFDLDDDGDLDILCASYGDGKVSWYENLDGLGHFGIRNVIDDDVYQIASAYAGDLDGDGDMDVTTNSEQYGIKWYENIDGEGAFGAPVIINGNVLEASNILITDIDTDGDQDIVTAFHVGAGSGNARIFFHRNIDGQGTFGGETLVDNNFSYVRLLDVEDIDNDGDQDIIAALTIDSGLVWYENLNGAGVFSAQNVVTTSKSNVEGFKATDIDQDGDLDMVICNGFPFNDFYWYPNLDGLGTFGKAQYIGLGPRNPIFLTTGDFDNDGDQDIASVAKDDNEVFWFENLDGLGNFSDKITITTNIDTPTWIFASDIDNNGKMDFATTSFGDHKLAWFQNNGILSTENNELNNFNFYPNPSSSLIYFSNNKFISKVSIYSYDGKLLLYKMGKSIEYIDLESLAKGIYIIVIEDDIGKKSLDKLIKK